MDRKSFFKNALLALGAAVVPNIILRAAKREGNRKYIEGYMQETAGPIQLYTYKGMPADKLTFEEMQEAFSNKLKTIEAKTYYWAEYESNPYHKKLKQIIMEELSELKRGMSSRGEPYRKYKQTELNLLNLYNK